MATNTYVPIATTTLSSTVGSYTFTSIPGTYTDLVLVTNLATDSATEFLLRVGNGSIDTGSNYSMTYLLGGGSVASSSRSSNGTSTYAGYTSTTALNKMHIFQFMNYSNTTTHKTSLLRYSAADTAATAVVSLWRSTSAINTIQIIANGNNLTSGSTLSLYGILAEGGAKATGGVVTSDANYYYHTFLASGTFTPVSTLSCDVLVVAGGGSAGSNQRGGGGGAGGLLAFTSQSVTATAKTVTVGAGGAATANSTIAGNVGSDSQFGALTLVKGGGGGSGGGANTATAGGSGGGASYYNYTGGSPTTSQGFAGGNSTNTWPVSAGGGGAGGVGGNTQGGTTGGVGGVGATSAMMKAMGAATSTGELSGGNYYYAGGGGGGSDGTATVNAGGLGGGGDGKTPPGEAGTANTGGGGGAGSYIAPSFAAGGAGGSGIVIVRYAKV